ncbi:N-acetylglucosamine-6-phosphate deacetylase [Microbacterium karelineae]|uniref:N-acetylglucosamine-6-phosphate deacetylase n=1 Tax=Microbacterium karelineae TaxID=2654283 RepID=UPI0012EA61A4|nr:N-acetylglucosamine-6-phosphate deacetylase [Microbacterium karelineae]
MTVIHSAQLVSSGSVEADAWVRFEGDRIAARGTGTSWRECAAPAEDIVDAAGGIITPGFIDLHCHGGGAAGFDGAEDRIHAALAVHRAHGTTRSVLSLVTATVPDLESQLETIARVAEADPLVLGSHLEGPFLDALHKGAHDEALLADPTTERVEALIAAARGRLVQVTIAPERPRALEATARFVEAGVRVAVGHTAADHDGALAAFDAGASILTHAFNAMDGLHHRAPGPIGAALARDHVTLELIDDGVHVHPVIARMLFDAAPRRVALVTDAMAAAGAADGVYILGSLSVTVSGGVARLTDGGAIAGSTLTMDGALRQTVGSCGVDLATAVDAMTRVPARALGRDGDLGALEVGFAADAVLLDEALRVRRVWGAGESLAGG